MATKNNPGAFDCYANAAGDEPLFVLLARDKHAPALVRLWALLRARDGEDSAKVAESLACAAAMENFRRSLGKAPIDAGGATVIERVYISATAGMAEHPEGFDCSCDCDLCRSYATD